MYHRSQFPSASAELLPARGTFKEELQLEEASAYLWLPSIELILKEPPFSQKETEDKVLNLAWASRAKIGHNFYNKFTRYLDSQNTYRYIILDCNGKSFVWQAEDDANCKEPRKV